MDRRTLIKGIAATAASMSVSGVASAIVPPKTTFNIVALAFDDYETLDLHGPLEMLGHCPNVNLKMVGARQLTKSYQNTFLLTDTPMRGSYDCDLFIIPGGIGTRKLVDNPAVIDWIKKQCEASSRVLTVCTGSALLAKTGLLSGKKATSNKQAFKWVTSIDTSVNWQPSARWCVDGKCTTSSGVSAGIDASIAVIRETFGPGEANRILELTEYVWNNNPGFDPFAVVIGD